MDVGNIINIHKDLNVNDFGALHTIHVVSGKNYTGCLYY